MGTGWGLSARYLSVWTCRSRCHSSSGFHIQPTVEEPQIGLVLHNTSRVGLPIFSYLSLGLKGFIRTRLHRVKSIKGGCLLLGKPLSILKPPSLPNHRYKPGFSNSRHHNLRLSSLESRFRRIITFVAFINLSEHPLSLLPTWLHIRLSLPCLASMNCFPVCCSHRSPRLMVLIILVLAHLLRPENDYNRHSYQEVCSVVVPDGTYFLFNHRLQRSHMPRPRCSSYPPTQRMAPSRPYSHHTESIAHDPRLHESDARPHAADHRKRSASQIYSFDVLRSDPMSSSLQHLTSSGSPPSHPSSSQQHRGPTSSSSEFRVSVPPSAAANIHSPQGQRSGPQRRDSDPASPAMISFPVSRPPASKSSKHTPSEEASDDEIPGESAGKKHICPTCLKRFNRPSSLRIHVNTHTGATRKNFFYFLFILLIPFQHLGVPGQTVVESLTWTRTWGVITATTQHQASRVFSPLITAGNADGLMHSVIHCLQPIKCIERPIWCLLRPFPIFLQVTIPSTTLTGNMTLLATHTLMYTSIPNETTSITLPLPICIHWLIHGFPLLFVPHTIRKRLLRHLLYVLRFLATVVIVTYTPPMCFFFVLPPPIHCI